MGAAYRVRAILRVDENQGLHVARLHALQRGPRRGPGAHPVVRDCGGQQCAAEGRVLVNVRRMGAGAPETSGWRDGSDEGGGVVGIDGHG